ncbi:hypothetical protein V1520DRAFT_349256, partial [Lipomyces starkeyi]
MIKGTRQFSKLYVQHSFILINLHRFAVLFLVSCSLVFVFFLFFRLYAFAFILCLLAALVFAGIN